MSFAALTVVLTQVILFGAAHQADEGAAAHVFQLLIVAQLPMVAWFAFKWLPRARHASLRVLAVQGAAILMALVPVHLFHL
ncbi:MAG: hypothetical protein ABI178_04760 [Rhodanobacter sp.]